MREIALTVSQLNEYVRRSLASDPILRGITLTGEISNFKRHVSGHWYFTLKDEAAAINCTMFRQSAMDVCFRPENGQRVKLYGSVGLYTKTGSYQFYADTMEQEGLGELYLRFEALKRKLAVEGLFDASIKKTLPLLPCGIGIVTSRTGAVVHDIMHVAWRRFPGIPLYLCPVKVQGEGAAAEIVRGIHLLDRVPEVEVIIVGRGGGSMEDLWAFNEEIVARAIAECHTPVVSAVGHETDFTIADFVADLRAPTPSAAAELSVPLKESLAGTLDLYCKRMEGIVRQHLQSGRLNVNQLQKRLTDVSPARRSERMRASLTGVQSRMNSAIEKTLLQKRNAAQTAEIQLAIHAEDRLKEMRQRIEQSTLRIRASGPMETMKRGYAILSRNGEVLRSASSVRAGDHLTVRMADGRIKTLVETVERDD